MVTKTKSHSGRASRKDQNFRSISRDYIDSIKSLAKTLPVAMDAIQKTHEAEQVKRDEFIKRYGTREERDGKLLIKFNSEQASRFEDILKRGRTDYLALRIVPRSFIVSLISQYDAFVSGLIRAVYLAKPELLNGSERSLTLAQLVELGSIEDAKESILEKEIESIMRESHTEQFRMMESKFTIPLRKGLDVWPDFVELSERRNLFVHTDGVVSTQYLKVCKEHQVAFEENVSLGDKLDVTPEYFRRAYECLYELGVKLSQVLWRKFMPDQMSEADSALNHFGYEPLKANHFSLAQKVYDFAVNVLKKHSSEPDRLVFLINYALSYKLAGDSKRALEVLDREDWRAYQYSFQLANVVIREQYGDAAGLMRQISRDEKQLPKLAWRNWPLFCLFRDQDEFKELFREIWDEPYDIVEIEDRDSRSPDSTETEISSGQG